MRDLPIESQYEASRTSLHSYKNHQIRKSREEYILGIDQIKVNEKVNSLDRRASSSRPPRAMMKT